MGIHQNLSWQLGDITLHRIIEDQSALMPIRDFLPNLSEEVLAQNRDALQKAGALDRLDQIILCFQSYVVKTPHHTILVDSCIGNHKNRPNRPRWHNKTDSLYMTALAQAGIAVEEIDFVMCTHLHVDHVGWNTRLENGVWVPTFPNARYLFSQKEYAYWEARGKTEQIDHIIDSVLPIVALGKADLVSSSEAVGDHLRLLPTPGHTIDHFAVALGAKRDDGVIIGDLFHSPIQMTHPELFMRLDYDGAQSTQSRKDFLNRYADTPTLCCTAHFPSPSMGHIKRAGTGFLCEMV
jgi:glyoxylase-like metal-dependent hydrolase (beta-lactamase superfamily II)